MTSEELNRTIEFIIQSQARLAAVQEQDRHWFKELNVRLTRVSEEQTRLLNHQSERMDRSDKFYKDWLEQSGDFQKQALHLLNLILDRLPSLPPREAT